MRHPTWPKNRRVLSIAAAGSLYFLLIFVAGTLLGVVRTFWLAPRIGALGAVACEVPMMLVIVWMSSRVAVRAFRIPNNDGFRLSVGAVAFVLLQFAEMAMARVIFGLSMAAYWQAAMSLAGALGLAAQLFVPWAPVLEGRSRSRRHVANEASNTAYASLAQIKTGADGIGDIVQKRRFK